MTERNEPGMTHDRRRSRWSQWTFPLVGFLALVWFLIRVVPKPSRAAYPCQRLAFPLASGFVLWFLALAGAVAAWGRARVLLGRSRRGLAACCLVAAAAAGLISWTVLPRGPAWADDALPLNPIGEARGVQPGRVAWVFDPEATDWQGPGRGHWWQPSHTRQEVVDRMLDRALRGLSGEPTIAAAWDRLFRHFNLNRARGAAGYQPGERITIKVNFVGAIFHPGWGGVNPATYDLVSKVDYMNTSPQLILALLRHLVYVVGVDPADVAVGDPLAYFPNAFYDLCHREFPAVRYLDYAGRFGRTRVRRSTVPLYWSAHPEGRLQDYVPASYAEADYLINLANLKSHPLAGVTLGAKNHFGSLIRWPLEEGYFDLHADLPLALPGRGHYRPLVDLMGHAHLGGKTLLYLIDGLYAGRHAADDWPTRWRSAPFDGDWSSSLYASQDPVAIDSVGLDFLRMEWDDAPHQSGTEDYLHEAAQADDPPSGTFYDPDHAGDVTRLSSLGVHEHWNSPTARQYSRNLGTGDGIELVALVPEESVAIDLGPADVGAGITHRQKAGAATVPAEAGGRSCRRNRSAEDRHFYFAVDDAFAHRGSRPAVWVRIDYFDAGTGALRLHYDSNRGGSAAARYRDGGSVALAATGQWKRYTFALTDAYFGNRQNLGADFRITGTGPAELFYLDLVRVSNQPPAEVVAIDLGTADVESGLTHPQKAAARTRPARAGGRNCRRNLDPTASPADRYFYFAVDDAFAWRGDRRRVAVTIDYFDAGTGALALQYDAAAGGSAAARYRDGGRVILRGTDAWRQHTFHLTDAFFGNRQNLGADLRIVKAGAEEFFYLDVVRVADDDAGPDPAGAE